MISVLVDDGKGDNNSQIYSRHVNHDKLSLHLTEPSCSIESIRLYSMDNSSRH